MSEQSDKNSLYYTPTPGEYLQRALKALDEATDENWRERVEIAERNLVALGDWMGGHLLFSPEEPYVEMKAEARVKKSVPEGAQINIVLTDKLVPLVKSTKTLENGIN